jgi:hypothetical protein
MSGAAKVVQNFYNVKSLYSVDTTGYYNYNYVVAVELATNFTDDELIEAIPLVHLIVSNNNTFSHAVRASARNYSSRR